MDYYPIDDNYGKTHHHQLLQESEFQRRYRQIRTGQPRRPNSILVTIGDWLITAGQKLQAQPQSNAHNGPLGGFDKSIH